MIPLKDENPTTRPAVVTVLLILVCAGVWLFVQQGQSGTEVVRSEDGRAVGVDAELSFSLEWAAIPCEVLRGEPLDLDEIERTFGGGDAEACADRADDGDGAGDELFPDKSVWLSVVVSMFLHGGFLHLAGNLLFLWIFGNNIEDRLGPLPYLLLYLVGGVVATGAHVLVNADSTVPVVGASGAIAAVMGAYLVWYPQARIKTLVVFFFITLVDVPAALLLGGWLVLQFFTSDNAGVAWVAHVGGFAFGAIVALLLGRVVPPNARFVPRRERPTLGHPGY